MSRADEVLSGLHLAHVSEALERWAGHEREMVIEIVRSLDFAVFAFTLAPNRLELIERDVNRHAMLSGAASALAPFLRKLEGSWGGVPWGPSIPAVTAAADNYLINCGRLAMLRRAAALERFGLATTTFLRDDYLVIETITDTEESIDRDRGTWLRCRARERRATADELLSGMSDHARDRIDEYCDVAWGWFIKYDPDEAAMAFYRSVAESRVVGCVEAEALNRAGFAGGSKP